MERLTYTSIKDTLQYKLLMNSYNWVHNLYSEQGDIRSANESYFKMKDISLYRELYLYNQTQSFDQLIRYPLGWIMKIYTDHGTNLAKAIVISIYIILSFAAFYFFFPSEWDTTSRGKLISNFKDSHKKMTKAMSDHFFQW